MVLDTGNMEGDQLSQSQGHLALTVWIMAYEVVSCLDEDDRYCSIGTLIGSYLVRILFHSVLKTISNLSHTSFLLSFTGRQSLYSHKPWLLKPRQLNADQYQTRPEWTLLRHYQFLVSDPCPCHHLANFLYLKTGCAS